MKFVFDWKKIKDYVRLNWYSLMFNIMSVLGMLFFVVVGAKVLVKDIDPPLDFAQLEGLVLFLMGMQVFKLYNTKKEKEQ